MVTGRSISGFLYAWRNRALTGHHGNSLQRPRAAYQCRR